VALRPHLSMGLPLSDSMQLKIVVLQFLHFGSANPVNEWETNKRMKTARFVYSLRIR
jgi:hypothetical protein